MLALVSAVGGQLFVLAVVALVIWAAGDLVCAAMPRRGAAAATALFEASSSASARAWPLAGSVPWGLQAALGFAAIAQALVLLGLLGSLRAPIVAILVLALLAAAAFRRWMDAATPAAADTAASRATVTQRGDADAREVQVGIESLPLRTLATLATVVTVLLAVTLALLAMYPPLGFDQTMYHLPLATAYAASGSLPFVPDLRYPTFPVLAELVNAAVLLFANDVATQMTGVCALAACAGLVFAWTRERSSGESSGAWLAVAIVLASPISLYLASTGYVEPMLALLGTAALYAADRARRETHRLPWILAAGALAGSAASVKYLGLYFIPAVAALLLMRPIRSMQPPRHDARATPADRPGRTVRDHQRSVAREMLLYGLAAAVALAPVYGRLIAQTGNPIFPFYPQLFGDNVWAVEAMLGPRGLTRLRHAATEMWDITFRRDVVGMMPPFSPALVLGLPLAAMGAWRDAALRALLLVAIAYMLVAPVSAHYFLAIAPVWSVVIGAAAAGLASSVRSGRRWLLGAALLLMFGGEAYALARLHRLGPPPVTMTQRNRLLAAERPLYSALAFVNHRAGAAIVYAIGAEHMVYYAAGTLLGDLGGRASLPAIDARARATGSLATALQEHDVAYLLVPNALADWSRMAASDSRLVRVYRDDAATVYQVRPEAFTAPRTPDAPPTPDSPPTPRSTPRSPQR